MSPSEAPRGTGGRGLGRAITLRGAASAVFAVSALLPLLVLALVLSRGGLLERGDLRLGLLVALAISVGGFFMLRRVVDQIARVAQRLQATAEGLPSPALVPVAGPVVPGVSEVAEIGQLGDAFRRMLDDLRQSTQRLEDLVFKLGTLNETVELAARVPRMQELLGLVLQNTMRAVGATVGSIMIVDPEQRVLRLAASAGLPDEGEVPDEVPLADSLIGSVVRTGQALLVEDIETDPRFRRPNAPRYANGSFLSVPIRAGERVVGAVNLAKRAVPGPTPPPFTPADLQFLNTLTTYLGYSVDNARLLEEAQRSAQRLQDVVNDLRATQAAAVKRETLRVVGQLSSGVAHHLNNLFAVIVGRTELLLRREPAAEVRRALEIVLGTAREGAEVIRRVQRFGHTAQPSPPGAVDLDRIVVDAVELTRPRWYDEAQLHGVRIDVATDLGALPPAVGEAGPLREAVMNVLLNAVDAMPGGGTVRVRTWSAGGRVHCAVSDPGVGMTEEVQRRAVEPFFTTKGPRSMGLGLSVAHATVERYGGSVTLETADGRGTTVTLTLPASAAGPAPPAPPAPPDAVGALRVLVIDDEEEVARILADLLADAGHRATVAAGGREALALLAAGAAADLVLTDLGMPDMSGWEVARAVRERWPGVAVGLVTGWSEEDLPAGERGLVDFVLAKPFDGDSLRAALAAVRLRDRAAGDGRGAGPPP